MNGAFCARVGFRTFFAAFVVTLLVTTLLAVVATLVVVLTLLTVNLCSSFFNVDFLFATDAFTFFLVTLTGCALCALSLGYPFAATFLFGFLFGTC